MAQWGFGLKIDDTAQDNGYERYEKNLLENLGAIAADNWEYNPLEATKTHRSINAATTESIRGGDVKIDRKNLQYQKYSSFRGDCKAFTNLAEFQKGFDIDSLIEGNKI